jgi:dihydrofolate reductase
MASERGEIMGKTIMGAVVSLDGFMADDNDGVGPRFDWLGNGEVAWSFPGSDGESRTTQASADFMLDLYGDMAANVIGRRVFDMTNGWSGKPAAGEHVFVVTHRPPTDWEYADTALFTFVDGVEKAITAGKEFAGDRVVDVAAGQIGGQALRLGLIDQVVVTRSRSSSGPAARSSPPAAWPSRCGWRTRQRSSAATGSRTWSTTSAAEARRPQRSGSPVRSRPTVASRRNR